MKIIDHHHQAGRIGLALAGGGPEGAVYEIGALRALDEAITGLDFNDVPVTVGVSAGALVGACLANGISTAHMVRGLVHPEPDEPPFEPGAFLVPALGDFVKRGVAVPGLVLDALLAFAFGNGNGHGSGRSGLLAALADRLGRAVPVGLFDNRPLRRYLHELFSLEGRTDRFSELKNELYVVATDLDSGEAVRFGEGALADVTISHAVQASTALPGLYPPVEVDGRYYVDGVLLKTVHASVALERGAGLVICVNPIVPVDTAQAAAQGVMRRGKLIDRGMPTVMSQALRTLVHSRLAVGLRAYDDAYEEADVLLFEPEREDYAMFFRNIFTFRDRKRVLEHAYRSTLKSLAARREEVRPILERHGLGLDDAVLDDPGRDLWASVRLERAQRIGKASPLARQLFRTLDALEDRLGA